MNIELVLSLIICILACISAVWFWTHIEKKSKIEQEENHREYLKTLSEYNSTKLKYPSRTVKQGKPTKPAIYNSQPKTSIKPTDGINRQNRLDNDYIPYIPLHNTYNDYSSNNNESSHNSHNLSCGSSHSSSDCGSSSCD